MKKLSFITALSVSILLLIAVIWGSGRANPNFPPNTLPKDLSGNINYKEKLAFFDGKKLEIPSFVYEEERDFYKNEKIMGVASRSDRWVDVDLSEQKIRAWDGGNLFLESLVSTGLPWWPTPTGEFSIWIKLRATRMEGGSGRYYYNLPNVPYVMFFQNDQVPSWRGFSLHGTYWHNDFGRVHSHGCVNLPTSVAKELYYFLYPILPEGKGTVYASAENPGSKVVIHE